MKRHSAYVLALSLGMATAVVAGIVWRNPATPLNSAMEDADAAFRDGVYQAKIDVEQGRTPHFRIGRWNSDTDRASFIAGYQKSYQRFSETLGKFTELSAAELVGYPDGMMDGVRHRRDAQPFQANQTDNYRNADRGYASAQTDHETYRQLYRRAYSDGYRHGYYSVQDRAQLKPMSESWSR